jgi:hypothetical protein
VEWNLIVFLWCRNETTTIKKYRNYENYYLHNARNLDGFKTKCSKEQKEVCEKR